MLRRPGFFRIFLVLLLGYAVYAGYQRYQFNPPEKPEIIQFVPYNYKATGIRYPLIVFSHGFMGCPKQSMFLIQGLVRKGYIVLAPRHRDATCGNDENNKFLSSFANLPIAQMNEVSFYKPEKWTEETEKDRMRDIRYTLDDALGDPVFAASVDTDKIGLMGHSLGGYTVLGIAGANESWKDARVKSVLALTPYVPPYLVRGTLKNITVPVMYHSGRTDWLTPSWMVHSAYHLNAPNKYYVEFSDDGHLSWMDLGKKDRRAEIIDYSAAFFDQTLKGQESDLLAGKPINDTITFAKSAQ